MTANDMKTLSTAILLCLCLTCGCSFDRTFFPIDTRTDENLGGNQETVVLKAADGRSIQHVMVKPRLTPKATIFVFHGSGSKVSNWLSLLQPLVDDRYQLFLMEYRGFGASEGEPGHDAVASDANRAFRYLAAREDVKDKPILLLGQSYGAQLAINVATRFEDDVSLLVTEGAFTSFRDIAIHTTPWIGKPFTWAVFVNPYSSVELIRNASTPKLIIHSQEDDVVPFFMGEQLYDAASSKKTFWKIRGKHTDALVDYPREFVSRLNEMAELPKLSPDYEERQ